MLNINFIQNNIDSGVIEFSITNGGQVVNITDQIITIAFLKPDNTLVIQDPTSGVTILDGANGKVQCILKSNTLAAVGIVKAEISFSEGDKKLSTATFNFTVSASIDNGEAIISTNELPKLDAKIAETEVARQLAITAANSVNESIADAQEAITSANNAVTTINNNT